MRTHWSYVFLALTHQLKIFLQWCNLCVMASHIIGNLTIFKQLVQADNAGNLTSSVLLVLCEAIEHYTDVTMSPMASQITSPGIVYSTVYWGADQRKHQSSASLAFVRRIHRGPVNSPHKRPVTRKCFHLMTSSCTAPVMWEALPCHDFVMSTLEFVFSSN